MVNKYLMAMLLFLNIVVSQAQYRYKPKTNFISPVDIPIVLAGTFGELRGNHFHGGLDIKTNGVEGANTLAIEDGYVYRIKVSFWGYGKALYVKHPNGYTSVYGHLSKFSPKIEAYVKKIQYEKEIYEIDVNPSKTDLRVKQGEVIAYTGNTGGSSGPHLHFEIRESSNQEPINPMIFGITAVDDVKPTLNALYAYPLSDDAQVNSSQNPIKIHLTKIDKTHWFADRVFASGDIGFAINAFDRLNDANNKNGVFSIEMLVDGQRQFYHDVSRFSYDETKYINKFIDYQLYKDNNMRLQKCFIESSNQLSTYDRSLPSRGYLMIQNQKEYTVTIIIKDFADNDIQINIPITGKTLPVQDPKISIVTNYFVTNNSKASFTFDGIDIDFSNKTFYDDNYLYLKQVDSATIHIHRDVIPLKRRFKIAYDVSKYPENIKENLCVALVNHRGRLQYVKTELKDNQLKGTAKLLGTYTIMQDFKAPEVIPINFKPKQWISSKKHLLLKIKDNLSGIKSYKGTINGEFVVFEWDYKTGLIRYDFADKTFSSKEHNLSVEVVDNAGNRKVYSTTFFRTYN